MTEEFTSIDQEFLKEQKRLAMEKSAQPSSSTMTGHESAAQAQATAAQVQTAIHQSEASSQPTGASASVGQRLAASMTEEEIRG